MSGNIAGQYLFIRMLPIGTQYRVHTCVWVCYGLANNCLQIWCYFVHYKYHLSPIKNSSQSWSATICRYLAEPIHTNYVHNIQIIIVVQFEFPPIIIENQSVNIYFVWKKTNNYASKSLLLFTIKPALVYIITFESDFLSCLLFHSVYVQPKCVFHICAFDLRTQKWVIRSLYAGMSKLLLNFKTHLWRGWCWLHD